MEFIGKAQMKPELADHSKCRMVSAKDSWPHSIGSLVLSRMKNGFLNNQIGNVQDKKGRNIMWKIDEKGTSRGKYQNRGRFMQSQKTEHQDGRGVTKPLIGSKNATPLPLIKAGTNVFLIDKKND